MADHRRLAATGLAATALVMMSGCGSSSKAGAGLNEAPSTTTATPAAVTTSSAAASPSPSTTSADATEKAKTDALAAYSGMVKAMTETLDSGTISGDLLKYSDGSAYDGIAESLSFDQQSKFVYAGQPQSSPKVTATNLSANPSSVTISDCFGGPSWGGVFIADDGEGHKKGESAGRPTPPQPLTATVENLHGRWKVTSYKISLGAKC